MHKTLSRLLLAALIACGAAITTPASAQFLAPRASTMEVKNVKQASPMRGKILKAPGKPVKKAGASRSNRTKSAVSAHHESDGCCPPAGSTALSRRT